MDLEPRLLRAFVAVAQELSFTRAAERLHIAQPALSVQIRQLEERVGAQLVERTTRRVALTPAGAALLPRASELLASLDEAARAVRAVAAGETGAITLGLLATGALDFTPRLLRVFAEQRPGVRVSVQSVAFDDPSGGVRDGTTDVALVWLPFRSDGLRTEPLFEDPLVAILAADHPLAEARDLTAERLSREPWVWVEGVDLVVSAFWTLGDVRGGPPLVGARVGGMDDILAAVRAGGAVATIPRSVAAGVALPGLRTRELAGLPAATVALCRRPEPGAAVDAFCRVAHEVAAGDLTPGEAAPSHQQD